MLDCPIMRELMKSVNVRPAQDDDARDIFAWRNDEITRKMSHSMNEIDWASHLKWYLSSLGNPNRCLLICYLPKTKKKVGLVRFTLENNVALTSINIAPSMRGQGLAKLCLSSSITFFKENHFKATEFEAEIKPNNLASRRAFEEVGFVFNRIENGVGYFTLSLA